MNRAKRLTKNENLYVYIDKGDYILQYVLGNLSSCIVVDSIPTEATEDGFVPVLCSHCFGHTAKDYEKAKESCGVKKNDKCYIGTAAIYENNGETYKSEAYTPPVADGDINTLEIEKYNLNLKDVKYMAHPTPAVLLWEHKGEAIGHVKLYWHVHKNNVCGVNALCVLNQSPRAVNYYNYAKDFSHGFSWTTMQAGNFSDVVVELSTVITPARAGCFALPFLGRDLDNLLSHMGFSPEQHVDSSLLSSSAEYYNVVLKKIVERKKEEDDEVIPVAFSSIEEMQDFLRDFAETTKKHVKLNKLMYKHKGKTAIECHEKKALENFSTINGQSACNVIAQTQIMSAGIPQTAQMASQAPPPPTTQPPPMFYYPSFPMPQAFPGVPSAPPSLSNEDLDQKIAQSISASFERFNSAERKRKAEEELHQTIDNLKRANVEQRKEVEELKEKIQTLSASIALEKTKDAAIKEVLQPPVRPPVNDRHAEYFMGIAQSVVSEILERVGNGPELQQAINNGNLYPHNPNHKIIGEIDNNIKNDFVKGQSLTPKGIPVKASADVTQASIATHSTSQEQSTSVATAPTAAPLFQRVSKSALEGHADTKTDAILKTLTK